MAAQSSFDIVSKFDHQELRNAVDQATREIGTRYDLKDTKTTIEQEASQLVVSTDSEMSLRAVRDILESKLLRRSLSLKILDYQKEEDAAGGRLRQVVKLREGLSDEFAKELSKRIRTEFKKVTPQIQGDLVRVSSKNRDDLQTVIQSLKQEEFETPLQFVNYR
ncbi:MAG TPA: YajQ family cyclic di-GMP-binding protein [Chloroflexi bacterium]|nr:YajQ family cyclic di-GMP-binding protein [Chloroflexota bacterium]HBY47614.1 YajQ family cyclic di-GMP-binding protein [Chloroflexota bacterium]